MDNITLSLSKIGVDVNNIISRLGDNEQLYISICRKFSKDPNYQGFQDAIAAKDYNNTLIQIHTLKGLAANLGFVRLEQISKVILEDVKNNKEPMQRDINELSKEYNKIINILNSENADSN